MRLRRLVEPPFGVADGAEITGILSVRDVVRCWTDDGAICEVPTSAAAPASG